jgi:hypothetical protein
MSVTKDQAQMLAALASACRPTGATPWDPPGILAAIGKIKHLSLSDVVLAVIRAADDRDAKTPGVISAANSIHWQERGVRPRQAEPYDRGGCCSTCSLPHEKCRSIWRDDHPFVSAAAYAQHVNRDPERVARILQSVRGEKVPMREPAKPRAAEERSDDHGTCETEIAAAMAAGKSGRAEFLSERCDKRHGEIETNPNPHATEARRVLAETEPDERDAS